MKIFSLQYMITSFMVAMVGVHSYTDAQHVLEWSYTCIVSCLQMYILDQFYYTMQVYYVDHVTIYASTLH